MPPALSQVLGDPFKVFYIQAVLRDVRNAGIGLLQGLGFMQEAS